MNNIIVRINTLVTEANKILQSVGSAAWRRLLLAAILFITSITIFVQLADEVLEGEPIGFDEPVLRFAESLANPAVDPYIVAVTELGGAPITIAVLVVGVMYYVRRNRYRAAAFLASAIGGAALTVYFLKLLFARHRPDLWQAIVEESTYSFPSGHAMASSAVAFSLMVLFWYTRWRWITVVLGLLYLLIISWTRVYLGVHYPSDIIAGWCISLTWVLLTIWMLSGKAFWRGDGHGMKWVLSKRHSNDKAYLDQ